MRRAAFVGLLWKSPYGQIPYGTALIKVSFRAAIYPSQLFHVKQQVWVIVFDTSFAAVNRLAATGEQLMVTGRGLFVREAHRP